MIGVVLSLMACTTSSSSWTPRAGNRYARGFMIEQQDTVCVITVFCPWHKDQVMARYRVVQPYRRLVCNSCTHVGFLNHLNALDCLVGVTDKSLVYTTLSDSVVDVGNSMSADMERILWASPEAVLLSTYSEDDDMSKRLDQLHIPVVYIHEWQENTPLGRAEWIRVLGALTGHLEEADSLFTQVCAQYEQWCALGNSSLSIMSGQDFRGTWYMPAGGTYMGQLFADAGYTYRYADDMRESSIPLTTEQVVADFQTTDIWVGVQARSLEQLRQIDAKHSWLAAFQSGRVYHFMKRTTPSGANDFWETGVVHPEWILKDLRLIQTDQAQDSLYFTEQLHE